jgi:hypothetical protein
VFCTPQCTPVPQMLVAKGPGAMSILAVVINKFVIILLRTGLLGAARSEKKCKQKSPELSIEGLSMRRSKQVFQPVHEYSSVAIGCNPRLFRVLKGSVKVVETPVDTGSLVTQNSLYLPLRNALTMLSPMSLP